ncbi:MAG: 50S ribosomal protein L11 methyltransferase [Candidatus ainarchaeum sp.]|nr:50S ribosomal protein L11 methyltransferase [Candidatus ainarchaeum sp.]
MQSYSEKYISEIKVGTNTDEKLRKAMPVFLNKEMYKNRLITFLIAQKFKAKKVVDLMCASGILSIALAKDLGIEVTANDLSPVALEETKRNAKLNNTKINTCLSKAELFPISSEDFFIIDPFGSPALALKNVLKSCKLNSIVCTTATDIAVLGGKYPTKSAQIYDAKIHLNGFAEEMRIRALLGFCESFARENNKSIEPLLAYTERHYAKVCFKVIKKNAKRNLGFVYYNPKTGEGFTTTKRQKEQGLLESENIWISAVNNIELKKNNLKTICTTSQDLTIADLFPISAKHYINIKKYFQYKKRYVLKKAIMQKYGKISPYSYTLFLSKENFKKIKII